MTSPDSKISRKSPDDGPYLGLTLHSSIFEPLEISQVSVGDIAVPLLSEPNFALSLSRSGLSLTNFIGNKLAVHESGLGRFFSNIVPQTTAAVLNAYFMHESGHFRLIQSDATYFIEVPEDVRSFWNGVNGINTNSWASAQGLHYPYEGIMNDISYIIQKFDLPFYHAISTKLTGGDGDIAGYLDFRHELGSVHEESWLGGLSLWMLVDLYPHFARVMKYAWSGEKPENPYQPGDWTLKTNGYLSASGPLYGLKFMLFLQGHSQLPTYLAIEPWVSPSHTHVNRDQSEAVYPFGVNIEMYRLPLGGGLGPFSIAMSYELNISVQRQNIWYQREYFEDQIGILLGASASFHFQTKKWELFVSAGCREDGFLWQESLGTGCSGTAGFLVHVEPNQDSQ